MTRPEWYMTPEKFADLIHKVYIDQLIETKAFNMNEAHHPEDLGTMMSLITETVTTTLVTLGKINET